MKTEYIAIQDPDMSGFTGTEVALVDDAFQHVCINHTATSVSQETHGVIWQIAEMGEVIPLATVFAADVGEVDEVDFAWLKEQMQAGVLF
jgi:hypothetical protein